MSDSEYNETGGPAGQNGRAARADDGNQFAWWDDRPLGLRILMGTGLGILLAGALVLFGFVTMWLWNWLMPDIFGLKAIDYWQAWGLILLSAIFFKRVGSGGSGSGRGAERKRKRALRSYLAETAATGPSAGPAGGRTE